MKESPKPFTPEGLEEIKKREEEVERHRVPPFMPPEGVRNLFEGLIASIKDEGLKEKVAGYEQVIVDYNNAIESNLPQEELQKFRLQIRDLYKYLLERDQNDEIVRALKSAVFYLGQKDKRLNP